ncbi:MAG: serine hydrolase [Gemmatimonadetes bacterium]|nr:serine hydrolase [Gemmatimonadota bacterium]NIO30572.1 serine hydrolase [Gemmatimonadota bacterium]
MRNAVIATASVFVVWTAIGPPPGLAQWAEPDSAAIAPRVDSVFSEYDRTDSPGCALGVIRDGELIYARGYGMANLDLGVAITPASVFRIGSTSKQFTAAAVVLAAQNGELSLDDDIRGYLPEMPDYGKTVTIRDLLHHTSGIRDYIRLMYLSGLREDDWYTDDEVLVMLARQQATNFEPGSEYLYSNSGYFLISQIIERATGLTLREYAQQHIFRPLGMTHTHFHDDHKEIVANRASGYQPVRGGGFRISMTTLDMVGDGGVFTTVEDLLMWDRNFYEPRVGGDVFLRTMLRRGVLTGGDTLSYALGLGHATYRGLPTVRHGGAWVGFRAQMIRFPEQRFSVICLCNLATANPTDLAERVADVYLADLLAPVEERERRGDRRPESEAAEAPEYSAAELVAFAGTYYSEELDADYRIYLEEEELRVQRGRGEPIALQPTGVDEFEVEGARVMFGRDGRGRPESFVLDAGRVRGIRFVRINGD